MHITLREFIILYMSGNKKLKKDLGLIEVFSISSGAMISSGLFVLPAIVYHKTGPFIILSYLIASVLMIPAMFSKAELSTAMPKSGGAYFFISRSMGPLLGTFAGMASWFSLALKSAFALMGIGIFLGPLLPFLSGAAAVKFVAIACLFVFTILNILSVKDSGRFQVIFLFSLLGILSLYIFYNLQFVNLQYFMTESEINWQDILKVTGMIFVSYGGLTKIAAIAEEVRNPGKNIPRGMFTSFSVVTLFYILTITVTVGILAPSLFDATQTPISAGGQVYMGQPGFFVLSMAAMFAFVTTGNAGIMAASRAPLAMARDNLIPGFFSHISLKFNTPYISILVTFLFMLVSILFLDIEGLVKVASTMMLILFSLNNISVIIMRESKISTYKPEFKGALYPFLPAIGTVVYFFLIFEMGQIPLLITLGFFVISLIWYFIYSRSRTTKDSALIKLVERITSSEIKTNTLTEELKEILIERDNLVEDRFDAIIKNTDIINLEGETDLEGLFKHISASFAEKFSLKEEVIFKGLKEREELSSTVISTGLAIPHIIIEGDHKFDILVFRSKSGIRFVKEAPLVNIVFALAGSKDERNFHLQALMAIAQIVQNPDFQHQWMKTHNTEELRNLILLAQRIRKARV